MEGENIVLEYRYADGNNQRVPDLAAELVRLNVDVILGDSFAASEASKATKTIPIVVIGGRDAVEAGLAASL